MITALETEVIVQIPISATRRNDKLIWTHAQDGEFSVKSDYHRVKAASAETWSLQPSSNGTTQNESWSAVWKLKTHPKIRTFMW